MPYDNVFQKSADHSFEREVGQVVEALRFAMEIVVRMMASKSFIYFFCYDEVEPHAEVIKLCLGFDLTDLLMVNWIKFSLTFIKIKQELINLHGSCHVLSKSIEAVESTYCSCTSMFFS